MSSCDEMCQPIRELKRAIYDTASFTNDALFFIIVTASIWFVFSMISTMQMQIITLYQGSPTFIIKQAMIVIFYISFFYIFFVDHFIITKSTNILNNEYRRSSVENRSLWLNDIELYNGPPRGNLYFIQDIVKRPPGFIAATLKDYEIEDAHLSQYKEYKNVFISGYDKNKISFFTIGEKNIQKTVINNSSIDDIEKILNQKKKNVKSFLSQIYKSYDDHKPSYMFDDSQVLQKYQKILSLFVAMLIPFTQLLSIKSVRSGQSLTNIVKAMVFSIISYTSFEVIKVIDITNITNIVTSIMVTISILLAFLSRFVKIYH